MGKRLAITVDGVEAEIELLEDEAPVTVAALWDILPIEDRTIQVRWSGNAWRTDKDYPIVADSPTVENRAERLQGGDLIYYPRLGKIGLAYDEAKWLSPKQEARNVTLVGRVDTNREAFLERNNQLIFEGPFDISITRIE